MKKIILVAAIALMSFAAKAQDLKFAYVDFNEVIMLMPEMDEARNVLEENQKTNEEVLMAMYEEYQTKMQQYEQKSATWTQAIRESKEREIMEIQSRLEQTQQSLQAPIVEKANNVINELAKSKGVAAVFEKASFIYVDAAQLIDLTPEARTALNIPEGRTLETLQAEMMAKAQAAQAQ